MTRFEQLGRPLKGSLELPADKSIAQRALILSFAAGVDADIDNLPDYAAVRDTQRALAQLAAARESGCVANLNCGNSGATARMLCGLVAGLGMSAVIDGGEQLRQRPMRRVSDPLRAMRVSVEGDALPLRIEGRLPLLACDHVLPVASAQVKSALLLAALGAEGTTSIVEPAPSRDHTERLMNAMGVAVESELLPDGSHRVSVEGPVRPNAEALSRLWHLPGDASSAAFLAVAAALLPGSEIEIRNLGLNPGRLGFAAVMKDAGADIEWVQERIVTGEPVGTLKVCCSEPSYHAFHVRADQVPSLIDEIPVLALFATVCQGESVFEGVGELRVKESNRLEGIVQGLSALGCRAWVEGDNLRVAGGIPCRAACLDGNDDHRMALTWALAGLCFGVSVEVPGFHEAIATSFPEFIDCIKLL